MEMTEVQFERMKRKIETLQSKLDFQIQKNEEKNKEIDNLQEFAKSLHDRLTVLKNLNIFQRLFRYNKYKKGR